MIVTSELRGEHYRDGEWVDRYGMVWKWDTKRDKWYGHNGNTGQDCWATDDEVSDYRIFGGRGPFLKLA